VRSVTVISFSSRAVSRKTCFPLPLRFLFPVFFGPRPAIHPRRFLIFLLSNVRRLRVLPFQVLLLTRTFSGITGAVRKLSSRNFLPSYQFFKKSSLLAAYPSGPLQTSRIAVGFPHDHPFFFPQSSFSPKGAGLGLFSGFFSRPGCSPRIEPDYCSPPIPLPWSFLVFFPSDGPGPFFMVPLFILLPPFFFFLLDFLFGPPRPKGRSPSEGRQNRTRFDEAPVWTFHCSC